MNQSEIAVFITSSSDLMRLERAINSVKLSFENVHVNINTLDTNFQTEATNYLTENAIPFTVSESNGTPSNGKNATFDYFKTFDYTWMVGLDGDDIIAENAFSQFEKMITDVPNMQVGIFLSSSLMQFDNDGYFIDPLDTVLENNYIMWSINRWMHMKSQFLFVSQISRPLIFHRSIINNDLSKYDENLIAMEDFAKSIEYDFIRRQINLNVVNFISKMDLYIYDISGLSGNFITSLKMMPEDFSEFSITLWDSIQNYYKNTYIMNDSETTVSDIFLERKPYEIRL
jgi:hypothetical protein